MSEAQEEMLERLRLRLRERAQADRARIVAFLVAPSPDAAVDINAAAHKMAGIAASLGYPELGQCAAAIDARPATVPADEDTLNALAMLVRRIMQDFPARRSGN